MRVEGWIDELTSMSECGWREWMERKRLAWVYFGESEKKSRKGEGRCLTA